MDTKIDMLTGLIQGHPKLVLGILVVMFIVLVVVFVFPSFKSTKEKYLGGKSKKKVMEDIEDELDTVIEDINKIQN